MSAIDLFRRKMENARVSEPAIKAFERAYAQLVAKETAMLPESEIEPVESLPCSDDLLEPSPDEIVSLLAKRSTAALEPAWASGKQGEQGVRRHEKLMNA
jgi:hypothetical protein